MASSATRLWGSSLSSMPLTMDASSLAPCFRTCKGSRRGALLWGSLAGTRPCLATPRGQDGLCCAHVVARHQHQAGDPAR